MTSKRTRKPKPPATERPAALDAQPAAEVPEGEDKQTGFTGRKAEVLDFGKRGIFLSVAQLTGELPVAKETLLGRLQDARLRPITGTYNQALYRLREVIEAVLIRHASGQLDPEKLDPYKRKAFYASELDKLALEQKAGELIPRIEVEQELARVAKMVTRFCDTLPDVLERDCGLSGAALVKVEESLDGMRTELCDALQKPEDAPQVAAA